MRTPAGAPSAPRPAALVGNEIVSWSDLTPALAEASGGAVLEEVCLDRLVAREMQMRGLTLDASAVQHEQDVLGETLALSAGVPTGQQGDVVQQLRRARGLGETRYAAMLKRNAMLRRMVRDEITITDDDVHQAHEIRYGQKFQTRLILVKTEREAADAIARVRGENGHAPEAFADVALSVSIDPSRLRGGALGAISPTDPSFPLAMRKAIAEATPGSPTHIVALEQGFAVLLVEKIIPATGTPFESVASSLEHEIRLVRERAAMDRLAAQLLRAAKITVLDPELQWSWQSRQQ